MMKSVSSVLALLAMTVALGGCYSRGGGVFSSSGGPQTYISTETMQKTITMVDVRTSQPFFTINIPPGKQLTIDFNEGEGDDPVNTPDLMHWELLEYPTRSGRLANAMSVPGPGARRIDVTLTNGVQYAEIDPQYRQLRTDEAKDRPDWWTPQGGEIPRDRRATMYDN